MNSKLKSILKISLPLLLSVVAVWYSFSIIPFGSLVGSFKEASLKEPTKLPKGIIENEYQTATTLNKSGRLILSIDFSFEFKLV